MQRPVFAASEFEDSAQIRFLIVLLLPLFIFLCFRGENLKAQERDSSGKSAVEQAGIQFDLKSLQQVPENFPAEENQVEGVKSFFFAGPEYRGQQTRLFAYYGIPAPSNKTAAGIAEKFPAMVLIHGGGGTAFDRWVKLWNSRGYAAIAMDLCGCVPQGTYGNWQRHELGGPPGWDASFAQLDEPIEDQWTFHAVSGVCLANSLIRSFPEVDSERIGVTGISWGGYLTCIVAAVDNRFRFAAPVYGCGYLGENSAWLPRFEAMGEQHARLWLNQWDPSAYLRKAKMPMLWVNGTNDFAYPMDSWKKSYLLPTSQQTLCLRIRMPHGHGAAGENPEEIHVFANSILKQQTPLPTITDQGSDAKVVWATFASSEPIVSAELCFTRDQGKWQDRMWESQPAEIELKSKRVVAAIPDDATVYYLNLFDHRQCAVSSRHEER